MLCCLRQITKLLWALLSFLGKGVILRLLLGIMEGVVVVLMKKVHHDAGTAYVAGAVRV